jgi:putative flippase GtrA
VSVTEESLAVQRIAPLALRARWRAWRDNVVQVARFLGVGAIGYVVNLAAYAAATHAVGLDYRVSAFVSFVLALLTTFSLNRHVTFAAGDGPIAAQLWRYVVVNSAGFATNLVVLMLLVDGAGVAKVPAEALAAAAAAPVNFLGGRLWAFDVARSDRR